MKFNAELTGFLPERGTSAGKNSGSTTLFGKLSNVVIENVYTLVHYHIWDK
jgi:hypothetical protein